MAQATAPAGSSVSPVVRAFLRETLETVLLALLLFLMLRVSIQNFRVEGSSMEPNIHGSEYVFVNKLAYLGIPWGSSKLYPLGFPKRGDIIVFHAPGGQARDFVKRVVGLPGDVLSIQDGAVSINGKPLDEPYKRPDGRTFAQTVVPPGQLYVIGDNRPASNDSRFWGTITTDAIIGRVWVRYWPLGKAQFMSDEPFLSTAATAYADTNEP